MLLIKYYLLLPLAKSFKLFSLKSSGEMSQGFHQELIRVQDDFSLSIEDYLAQEPKLEDPLQLKKILVSPFSRVFLAVPDIWLRSIKTKLPLTDSEKVKSLAALALASEISHLTPDQVCYRHTVDAHEENRWQLDVTTAPKLIYDFVQALLPKASRFHGLVSAKDCNDLLFNQNDAVSLACLYKLTIRPSNEQEAYVPFYARPSLILICLAFISQLALLYSYESEKHILAVAQMNLAQAQANSVSLASIQLNPSAKVAKEVMQSLTEEIRIDSIISEDNVAWLGLTLDSKYLLSAFPIWQSKWQGYTFTLMDEWLQPIDVSTLNLQQPTMRTRSVLNVVIQIQKQ